MSTNIKRTSESIKAETKDVKRQKHVSKEYEVTCPKHVQNLLNELKHCDPVLQLHMHPTSKIAIDSPDITAISKDLLQSMLYPLSPRDFKSSCFRKKAVHIRSNRKDRAHDISANYMFGLDPKQIFEETSSDSIFLWIPSTCKDNDNDKNDNDKSSSGSKCNEKSKTLLSIDIQDPNTAHVLHQHSNYASYCRAPPELEQPLVSSMLKDVGLGLGQYDPTGEKLTTLGRGEVETFIGTKGHLTDWHTDFQENFTIQLSGRKKWTLKQGTVKHPTRGTTPHYRSSADVIENQIKAARLSNPDYQFGKQDLESNAFGNEVDIIMDAGDVLYFPAGMFHKVETLEKGVSINISLMGSTYASLVCKTLEHLLLEKEEWREVICSSQERGSDVLEKLKSLISSLPSVVEHCGECGLAEGILPPVLRQPPTFQLVEEEQEIEESESGEDDGDSPGEDGDGEVDDDVDDDDDDDDDEHIVDINEFELPEDFNSITPSRNKAWRRNPLASLMRMTDVKSFFEDKQHHSEEDTRNLFILNINFAGNEMHESAVRVILRDESGRLEYLCSLQGKSLDEAIEALEAPQSALRYYGFII